MIALQNQLVEASLDAHQSSGLLITFACLLVAGCKKDAEVKTILADFDSFTAELVKRVDAASNPADGVDDAQKYFDSKKTEMTGKMEQLKTIRGYQVGEETKKMMEASLVEDAKKIANLQVKYMGTSMRNDAFKAKLDKLTRDYQSASSRCKRLLDQQAFRVPTLVGCLI
jgi:adenine-specific DNA methylase